MKIVEMAIVLKNSKLVDNIYELIIKSPKIVKEAKAGQFVNVYTGLGEQLLPRPISICEIDKVNSTLKLIYQVVGKGTTAFTNIKLNDKVKVLGSLGNGFNLDVKGENHFLIGGGIGIFPLYEIAKQLKGNIYVFIGSKDKPLLVEQFQKLGVNVFISTETGSFGVKGTVLDMINKIKIEPDNIFSCGPKTMLKFVSMWANVNNKVAQISMEERMACGIGACVGCAVKIKKANEEWQHLKVCKDGPVFLSNEVIFDE